MGITKEILSTPCLMAVTFSVLLITTSTVPHALLAQTNTNFTIYRSPVYGIQLQYPSDWEKQENGTTQDTQTDVVTFLSPVVNSNANLDITVDNISDEKGILLTQYANQSIADLKQSLTNLKLIESTSKGVVIAGIPAYKTVYTSSDGNTILQTMEIGMIKGDKVYVLTYEAPVQEYSKYLPIIQKMIDSFQITK